MPLELSEEDTNISLINRHERLKSLLCLQEGEWQPAADITFPVPSAQTVGSTLVVVD